MQAVPQELRNKCSWFHVVAESAELGPSGQNMTVCVHGVGRAIMFHRFPTTNSDK